MYPLFHHAQNSKPLWSNRNAVYHQWAIFAGSPNAGVLLRETQNPSSTEGEGGIETIGTKPPQLFKATKRFTEGIEQRAADIEVLSFERLECGR